MLVPHTSDSEAEYIEHAEELHQVKAVLEEGGHFSGIYRKVQLKPLKWVKVAKGDTEEEHPIKALMILKYGGVLTHAGRRQIEKLNLVIKELVKEKDEEKERFNGIIAGLLAEKEKDKVDKDAMLDRMSQIEAMLTDAVRR